MLLVSAPLLGAQSSAWHGSADVSGNVFFGASQQTLFTLGAGLSHSGEGFTSDVAFRFRYGESENDQRVKFVNSRALFTSLTLDAFPRGRLSPFLLGSAESSLEKRIASRISGGAGMKWTLIRRDAALHSISLALLSEHTRPRADTAVRGTTFTRWSWRIKSRQSIGERVTLAHVTFYAPRVYAPEQYTVATTTTLAYAVTRAVALTAGISDNYDSQAKARGAIANNDGAMLFGLKASF